MKKTNSIQLYRCDLCDGGQWHVTCPKCGGFGEYMDPPPWVMLDHTKRVKFARSLELAIRRIEAIEELKQS